MSCFFRLGRGLKFEFQLPYWGRVRPLPRGEAPRKFQGVGLTLPLKTKGPLLTSTAAIPGGLGACPKARGGGGGRARGPCALPPEARLPAVTDCDLQSFRFLSFSKHISP